MIERAKPGFVYEVEHIRNGEVIDRIVEHNIMPSEGISHMLGVTLLSGAQVAEWYLGMYTNDYAPQPGDVANTFPTLAGETGDYVGATRHALVLASSPSGVVSNEAARTEVEFTAARTVRGGFVSSSPTKGSTAGILLSAVRFNSPRQVASGDILRVTAGIQIVS